MIIIFRITLQFEITNLAHELGITTVYVTHDQTEALTMSDRVAVFENGRIQQLAPPDKLYEEPENSFVAQFIGENNTLEGVIKEIKGGKVDFRVDKAGIVHASIIGRKEWFLRNKYDTKLKLAQDYDLWLRASKNNDLNIFLMNEPLYYYREIGSINPIKMLLAYSYERQMYKKYVSDFKFLVFKSYLKSIIVKFLCVINQFQFLINRRSNQVIDTTVLKRTNLEIQTIENTNVNGLI